MILKLAGVLRLWTEHRLFKAFLMRPQKPSHSTYHIYRLTQSQLQQTVGLGNTIARMEATTCTERKEFDLSQYNVVEEGTSKILFPKVSSNEVFYNDVQEFNRDISIAAITEFAKIYLAKKDLIVHEHKQLDENVVNISDEETTNSDKEHIYPGTKCKDGISILEALSASGLRSVRMANEISGVKRIVANDISAKAVEAIERNISFNNVGDIVTATEEDACVMMLQHKYGRKEQFDVVDLDPYGSAAPFLDSAVQAVKPSGLLCVTCTDMAVLAGNTPEKCWAKYQSMPIRMKACHEQALRILLGSIENHANVYSRYIEPLVSISVDFYIRIFVRVYHGPGKVKDSASKQSYVVKCAGCGSFKLFPVCEKVPAKKTFKYVPGHAPKVPNKCEFCGHQKHTIGGPIWNAPLHNPDFVQSLLSSVKAFPNRFKTSSRIIGILSMIQEELSDAPLYYTISELAQALKTDSPPEKIIKSGICNAGYQVSGFHGQSNTLKTNAPNSVIWDAMKAWILKSGRTCVPKDIYAKALHDRELTKEIDFTIANGAESKTKIDGVIRFPDMPANWGPKARAKVSDDGTVKTLELLEDKRKRLQGKRKTAENDEPIKTAKIET